MNEKRVFKVKELLTEPFAMRVKKSMKVKEDRARELGLDVVAEMRSYYEAIIDDYLTEHGQTPQTLIPGKANSLR